MTEFIGGVGEHGRAARVDCGTKDLAARLPTVVVTTSTRLVPGDVFRSLHSSLFEHVPLDVFETVVVGGEVLTPSEAGRRAASLREHS